MIVLLGTACKPEEFPGARERLKGPSTATSPARAEAGDETERTDSSAAEVHTRAEGEVLSTTPGAEKSSAPAATPVVPLGATPPVRGLWVLAEGSVRALDDPARIAPLLDRAERIGVTDLFVQVYRGGRAFYAAEPTVERAPSVATGSVDSLSILIRDAHARGMRVHGWVNVLSLSTRRDAKILTDLGRDAIHVDRRGRSLLDYPDFDLPEPDRQFYRMGTPGLYLDPAVPAVRARLVATFRDLVSRHPGLDGLHLDYIRHPDLLPFIPGSRFGVGLEFGYGAVSRARYREETGNPDPIEGAAAGVVRAPEAWDAWRRKQVTTLVEEIGAATRAARPGLMLTAAVIPYVERCYLSLAQDWPHWLETGALDRAIPMVYTLDDQLLRYQLEGYSGLTGADRIWPGLGVWLFASDPSRAVAQLQALRNLGFGGEVLFSDDAIEKAPALLEALAVRPARTPASASARPVAGTPVAAGR
ncbi:MAG: family 10 glycosylhydrolase [Deltaproteobacteria bacterium]|nr:family 10 glycosylhydrolase [Deltaproteobacteria bacterium]